MTSHSCTTTLYSRVDGLAALAALVPAPDTETAALEPGQPPGAALLAVAPALLDLLTAGATVADLGCSQGTELHRLARLFPNSLFLGYSTDQAYLLRARAAAGDLPNLMLIDGGVRELTASGAAAFDLILAGDLVSDEARPGAMLARLHASLKADGRLILQVRDSATPAPGTLTRRSRRLRRAGLLPLTYTIACSGCQHIEGADSGFGDRWIQAQTLDLIASKGFSSVKLKRHHGSVSADYYIARR